MRKRISYKRKKKKKEIKSWSKSLLISWSCRSSPSLSKHSNFFFTEMKCCAFAIILWLTVHSVYTRPNGSGHFQLSLFRSLHYRDGNSQLGGIPQQNELEPLQHEFPDLNDIQIKEERPCKCDKSYEKFIKDRYSRFSKSKIRGMLYRFGK